jgi:hypothetical protein
MSNLEEAAVWKVWNRKGRRRRCEAQKSRRRRRLGWMDGVENATPSLPDQGVPRTGDDGQSGKKRRRAGSSGGGGGEEEEEEDEEESSKRQVASSKLSWYYYTEITRPEYTGNARRHGDWRALAQET